MAGARCAGSGITAVKNMSVVRQPVLKALPVTGVGEPLQVFEEAMP